MLETSVLLSLAKKKNGQSFDLKEINYQLKNSRNIEFNLNYLIYQLLENISYLKTAYNQIQVIADNLEPDLRKKFLSYPIPKAIINEWKGISHV